MELQFCGCRYLVDCEGCSKECEPWQARTKSLEVGTKVFEIPFSDGYTGWGRATVVEIRGDIAVAEIFDGTLLAVEISSLELAEHGVLLVPSFGHKLLALI